MSDTATPYKKTTSGANTYLLVPLFLFFALLIFAVIRSPSLISPSGIGSAVIVVAPLILATYALTVVVMAGRGSVDLSIGPLIGFINVCLIQLSGQGIIESPIPVLLFAIGVGVVYQLLMGLIVVFVRVQPIIVSLSGYLSLVGLNLVILPRPGGVAPEWMLSWGAGTTIFSPVFVIIVLATAGWYILAQTSFWNHLKMMGSDERAAYTSGVQINLVRIGAHMIAGVFAGLASITFTSLISSGDPSQGTTYTLMAVTALVLGGASLAGGRGGAFGSLLGAVNIYLVTYVLATFSFGTLQSFVTDLAFGSMLVFSLLISLFVPQFQRHVRGLSPLMFSIILAIPAVGVVLNRTRDASVSEQQMIGLSGMSTTGEQAAQTVGMGGAIFMVSVIGIVALIALVRLFLRMQALQALGLAAVLVATGFGLTFHGSSDEPPVKAEVANVPNVHDGMENPGQFFTFEAARDLSSEQAFGLLEPDYAVTVLWLVFVVLLSSLLVILALPKFSPAAKRVALWWFAVGAAGCLLAAIFFPDFADDVNLLGDLNDYHIALLVGVLLFGLSGPLVQSPLRNVTQLMIVILCVSFSGSVLLLAKSGITTTSESMTGVASSILDAPMIERPTPEIYPQPDRAEPEEMDVAGQVQQLAFALLLILLAQYAVGHAMGETSFRKFWPYLPITAMATLVGGLFAFALGISFWKILMVLAVGIPSTPLVLHILKTYRTRGSRRGGSNRFASDHDASLRENST